jgi:hypothetical protein
MRRTQIARTLAATTGLAAVAILGVAAPAQAADRDGTCDSGEFCYYYNSNNAGSISDFGEGVSVSDYGTSQPTCYDFKGPGNGQHECIKNNAASVWNHSTRTVRVYFNSGYAGSYQDVAPGYKGNLNATLYNQNASHQFVNAYTNMSYALYQLSGGRITCGFDGYVNTPGRHEGIDIARSIGSPVRALVSGQVINIVRGANGSGGLSTIAIYNATYDKTIIYLHSAPLSSLSVGQSISVGQQIATEAWRGVSSSSSAHTHIEMRLGRQQLAAKSVGDPQLDNPDPTSFWNARGYKIA